MKKYTYIPFGTRCSAATILKENLHKRGQALPFDWIDIPLKSLASFIPESRDHIENHVFEYLMGVENQRHTIHDVWFVHDFPKGRKETPEEFEEIKAKYIRRFNRLFDVLEQRGKIVLLTVIPHINDDNGVYYEEAVDKVCSITKNPVLPLSVNLYEHKSVYEMNDLRVQFKDDWDLFHKEVAKKLTTHSMTKDLFV